MNFEILLAMIGAGLIAAIATWLYARHAATELNVDRQRLTSRVRELEEKLHLQRRDALEDLTRQKQLHYDELQAAKEAFYSEGRRLGCAEGQSEHLEELIKVRAEYQATLQRERQRAADDARDQLRAEYNERMKLFDVKISPYVEVLELDSYFSKEEEIRTGYQVQLLVNGIPAFQPHVVIEKSERRKKTKEQNVEKFVELATKAATEAVKLYLGGAGKLVTVGKEIVKRIPYSKKLLPRMPIVGTVLDSQ